MHRPDEDFTYLIQNDVEEKGTTKMSRSILKIPMDNGERIGRLETSVESLHGEFSDLKETLGEIQKSINRAQRTDWQTIFAGLIVVGALYASAIRPIETNVQRTDNAATKLAEAVITANEKVSRIDVGQQINQAELDRAIHDIKEIRDNGSPITDKRLTILESKIKGQQ